MVTPHVAFGRYLEIQFFLLLQSREQMFLPALVKKDDKGIMFTRLVHEGQEFESLPLTKISSQSGQ